MPNIDYYKFIVTKRGSPYSSPVQWSHYARPIDQSAGRAAGNSRIWGDASAETQKAAIDSLVTAAQDRGLSTRETAHVLAIARTESGFNPDAAAGTTSASGLGQFIDRTGKHYDLDASNRWNVNDQAGALVDHFIDNRDLAVKRGLGEDYIYKFHHDGPVGDYKGLDISRNRVMPLVDSYEAALKAGETPAGGGSGTVASASTLPNTATPPSPAGGGGYTVQSGDSLSRIAADHGVSVTDLTKLNGISDPNRINAGQTLTFPGQGSPAASVALPAPPADPLAGARTQGDFGTESAGGSADSPTQLASADAPDGLPALTDQDEAELTPNFASWNMVLNGGADDDLQTA